MTTRYKNFTSEKKNFPVPVLIFQIWKIFEKSVKSISDLMLKNKI